DLDSRVVRLPAGIRVRPYAALPAISITHSSNHASFEPDPVWYRKVEFSQDLERGYDGHEDQFSPGFFHLELSANQPVVVAATSGEPIAAPEKLWERESTER